MMMMMMQKKTWQAQSTFIAFLLNEVRQRCTFLLKWVPVVMKCGVDKQ
jgi:hypothetical protein